MDVSIIVQKLQAIDPRFADVRNDPKLVGNISKYEENFFSKEGRKKDWYQQKALKKYHKIMYAKFFLPP